MNQKALFFFAVLSTAKKTKNDFAAFASCGENNLI